VEQERIVDTARLKMPLDHEGAVASVRVIQDFGGCGHGDKTSKGSRGSALIWIRCSSDLQNPYDNLSLGAVEGT
jgi:hypothetical protein